MHRFVDGLRPLLLLCRDYIFYCQPSIVTSSHPAQASTSNISSQGEVWDYTWQNPEWRVVDGYGTSNVRLDRYDYVTGRFLLRSRSFSGN